MHRHGNAQARKRTGKTCPVGFSVVYFEEKEWGKTRSFRTQAGTLEQGAVRASADPHKKGRPFMTRAGAPE